MNKRVKVLVIFNCISYLLILYLSYNICINPCFKIKFVLNNLIILLMTSTSFILAYYILEDLKVVKKEIINDWIIRILIFTLIIEWSNYFNTFSIVIVFIIIGFIINITIEFIISKKLKNYNNILKQETQIYISTKEKNDILNYAIAVNTSIISLFLFYALCLATPINKYIVGEERILSISIGFSLIVFLWFINKIYNNYMILYSNKIYAKTLFIKDGIYVTIGYNICLVSPFYKLNSNLYGYITLIGILFTLPMINTLRKNFFRLKLLKDNLD